MLLRLFGWFLVILAFMTASGEAVMALGTGNYAGLATGEVWTLLAGQSPLVSVASNGGASREVVAQIATLPAWAVIAPLGIALIVLFRSKPRRSGFHHTTRRSS